MAIAALTANEVITQVPWSALVPSSPASWRDRDIRDREVEHVHENRERRATVRMARWRGVSGAIATALRGPPRRCFAQVGLDDLVLEPFGVGSACSYAFVSRGASSEGALASTGPLRSWVSIETSSDRPTRSGCAASSRGSSRNAHRQPLHDLDPVARSRFLRRQQGEGAAGARRQPDHAAVIEGRAAIKVGAQRDRLADADIAQLRLLEVRVDPDVDQGTMASSGAPGATCWPSCTLRFAT